MKEFFSKIFNRQKNFQSLKDLYFFDEYRSLLTDVNFPLPGDKFQGEFLGMLTRLVTNGDRPHSILYHSRSEGDQWQFFACSKNVEINITDQLVALSDQHPYLILDSIHPLTPKLHSNGINLDFKSALLFQLFNHFDYLLLMDRESKKIEESLGSIKSFVIAIKEKYELVENINSLKRKISDIENRLILTESELDRTDKALKKRAFEIHNILEISNELYSILNLKQLINSALLIIVGQITCQKSFALLYDPVNRNYSRPFSKGISHDNFDGISIEIDYPLIKYFLQNQKPIFVDKISEMDLSTEIAKFLDENQIKIIAPIIYSQRVRGIIGCGAKLHGKEFERTDLEMFNILLNIISISVGNAQTYEEVKNLSLTDAMTNLHNYRYFEERLKEEINRARRNNGSVSLIMLDIDHFKNYNDTLGHQAGDEALRTLSWVLKNSVREEDVVNRYGGEEFSIILPGIDKNVIKILGERIRERVEKTVFFKENIQPGGLFTVSLGAASFPDDAADFEDLVYKSDQALYRSKNSGRNCFTLYNAGN
ncbi:MAG: diguanylate cyclase [Calditrichaceae bacterium]